MFTQDSFHTSPQLNTKVTTRNGKSLLPFTGKLQAPFPIVTLCSRVFRDGTPCLFG